MTASPILVLNPRGLYSKYGFNDGDMPDHIREWFESQAYDLDSLDWHETLFNLVNEFVLPRVTLPAGTSLWRIHSAHNPARVRDEAGNDVYDSDDWHANVHVDLSLPDARDLFEFEYLQPWEPNETTVQAMTDAREGRTIKGDYNLNVTESGRKDNVNVTVQEGGNAFYVGNGVAQKFLAQFSKDLADAEDRAQALAAELNEANKPRYEVVHSGTNGFIVRDTLVDEAYFASVGAFATSNPDQNRRLADEYAAKLNSGEIDNE